MGQVDSLVALGDCLSAQQARLVRERFLLSEVRLRRVVKQKETLGQEDRRLGLEDRKVHPEHRRFCRGDVVVGRADRRFPKDDDVVASEHCIGGRDDSFLGHQDRVFRQETESCLCKTQSFLAPLRSC
jgi:hypothetical protein